MAFNFVAEAQENGIFFVYPKENNRGVYVKREGKQIKYYEEEDDEVKIENCIINFLEENWQFYISIGIGSVQLFIPRLQYGCLFLLLAILIWESIDEYKVLKRFTLTRKQYHAAEHMILNASKVNLTIEELRHHSWYSNDCGNNEVTSIFVHFIIWIFASILMNRNAIVVYLISIILSIFNKILKNSGMYNHMIQKSTLAKPTNEQLELAIAGYNKVYQEEKEAKQEER